MDREGTLNSLQVDLPSSYRNGDNLDLQKFDDDGRPRRTGTMWTTSAHIITAVIGSFESFSLVADANYISQSLGRIMCALFEICLRCGWCTMTALFLEYCKAVDRQIWPHQHPLRQFERDLSL